MNMATKARRLFWTIGLLLLLTPLTLQAAAKTQQEAVDWLNSMHDKTAASGKQCVDFYKQYLQSVFGVSYYSVGNAKDIAVNKKYPANWTITANPQPGDIAVYDGSQNPPYGHVGIVVAASSATNYDIMDLNSSRRCEICQKSGSGMIGRIHKRHRTNRPSAFIRPQFDAAVVRDEFEDISAQFVNQTIAIKSVKNNKYISAWMNTSRTRAPAYARVDRVGEWEKFQVEAAADGWIALKSVENKRYLSATLSPEKNVPVLASAQRAYSWEHFKFYKKGNDVYIKARANGKWLSAFINLSYAPIRATQSDAQSWERFSIQTISTSNLAGKYYIRNVGANKHLDTYMNRSARYTNIDIWTNDYTSGLKFTLTLINGAYQMKPDCSTRVVNIRTNATAAHGMNVCLFEYVAGDDCQLWEFDHIGGGVYIIRSKSNRNVVLTATGTGNGANVNVQNYNANSNMQKWTLEKIG